MNVVINGEPRQLEGLATVADLVRFLGYEGKRIAIERNGDIVPRSAYEETGLADGDEFEVVVAVGGG